MGQLSAPDGFSDGLRDKAKPLLPMLDRLAFESEKVGLISFAVDGEPIVGALPELQGLLIGATFHSGGFGYNPVAGMLLAELASTGETELDIAAFSPSRIDSGTTDSYLSSILRQKDAFSRRH